MMALLFIISIAVTVFFCAPVGFFYAATAIILLIGIIVCLGADNP
jgi:hypothetical protein